MQEQPTDSHSFTRCLGTYRERILKISKPPGPVLGMEGFDAIGLQALGGFSALSLSWKIEDCKLDGDWAFYVHKPPTCT